MARISIEKAIEKLNQGRTVAIPTETVYGLAARIDRKHAVEEIFTLKARPHFDPLIVHVTCHEQAQTLTSQWTHWHQRLAKKYWPGPLTLIAPKNEKVSPLITSGFETVALRAPDHPLTQDILAETGPLAAPSANRFGRTSPTRAEHVEDELGVQLPVVDGGPCQTGVESTIVAFHKNQIHILRSGAITRADIEQTLSQLPNSLEVIETQAAHSPGHLKNHYQPSCPLALVPASWDKSQVIAFFEEKTGQRPLRVEVLRLPEDPVLAARHLYHEMRVKSLECDLIYVGWDRQHLQKGLWEAIKDRLVKASSYDWRQSIVVFQPDH